MDMRVGRIAWCGAIGGLMLGGPALAQTSGLARCLAITDSAARLNCYDALARAEQAAEASGAMPRSSATAAPPSPPAPQQANPREEFGFGAARREERRAPEQRQLDQVEVTIAQAREMGAGYWQFVMTDGSTWRLAEVRNSFRPPRVGDTITLRRASLGSYLLDYRSQPSIRIKRIN